MRSTSEPSAGSQTGGSGHVPLKVTARRLWQTIRNFLGSEDAGPKAKLMLGGLVGLLCGVNGLNVVNSYVGRNFMTAIAERNTTGFVNYAILYVGVFAALTFVSVLARYAEEALGLLWREFLTKRVVTLYLAKGTYYRLDASGKLTHPDQRIAEDIRAFTVTTLSFLIMALGSCLTILAFSGVLWSISPLLFIVAVLYAACGSYLTISLGRPLIALNYDRLDKEATFRSGLIHVRENAEAIMATGSEGRQTERLMEQLGELVANFRTIIVVNRNVGFFTTGYNWLIQLIPALIVAPAFISGRIEFGVITQSSMAFAAVVAAFSLIVTQFQSISTFAAVVSRLELLADAVEQAQATDGSSAIEIIEQDDAFAYEALTLTSPESSVHLVKDLSASIPPGWCVLLKAANPAAGTALFSATAGVWTAGAGRILRPKTNDILFLPQRPYLPYGTLRQILVASDRSDTVPDELVLDLLSRFNLRHIAAAAQGLKNEEDWATHLSLREQQLLAVTRTLIAAPRVAFLDRIETTLGPDHFASALRMFQERSIAFIHHAEADVPRDPYDAFLELADDGGWTWATRSG